MIRNRNLAPLSPPSNLRLLQLLVYRALVAAADGIGHRLFNALHCSSSFTPQPVPTIVRAQLRTLLQHGCCCINQQSVTLALAQQVARRVLQGTPAAA